MRQLGLWVGTVRLGGEIRRSRAKETGRGYASQVECLVMSHETIEMLSSYQPLVAFRCPPCLF